MTDTKMTKNIFDKRCINNKRRRSRSCLEINTEKIVICTLEKMILRPERKIVINGLPRTSRTGRCDH
jgi:hypothetical protein